MSSCGSFCSGYGGLDLAAEAVLGCTPAWFSEIEAAPSRVLAHHWPSVPNLGNLCTVNWSTVEPVDVVVAGYPCQGFSVAGRRLGLDDERFIWPWIANAIRELRPRLVLLENVAGHIRLGLDAVLSDLAALGFDAEWCVVRASEVGAPHRRERLFIVAADTRCVGRGSRPGLRPSQPRRERGRRLGDDDGAAAADADQSRSQGRSGHDVAPREDQASALHRSAFGPAVERWERLTRRAPDPVDGRGRLAPEFVEWMMGLPNGWVTGVEPSRTAALKMLGNGVVPQQAIAAYTYLLEQMAVAA